MRIALVFALVFSFSAFAGPKAKGSAHKDSAKKATAPSLKLKPMEDASPDAQPQAQGAGPPTRGPTRIDFDDRLIQGQTNKSGAVYLYDRKELKQRSMIKTRDSFRDEIVNTVYDG